MAFRKNGSIDGVDELMLCANDKDGWVKFGNFHEKKIIKFLYSLGYPIKVNPEKKLDKYAPDAIFFGQPCDIKIRQTPFFTSENPQFNVTVNVNKIKSYIEKYGENFPIIIFVNWKKLRGWGRVVKPMRVIALTTAGKVREGRIHFYESRREDERNARCSHIVNLLNMKILYCNESFRKLKNAE
jgi:hypothetical protein